MSRGNREISAAICKKAANKSCQANKNALEAIYYFSSAITIIFHANRIVFKFNFKMLLLFILYLHVYMHSFSIMMVPSFNNL